MLEEADIPHSLYQASPTSARRDAELVGAFTQEKDPLSTKQRSLRKEQADSGAVSLFAMRGNITVSRESTPLHRLHALCVTGLFFKIYLDAHFCLW